MVTALYAGILGLMYIAMSVFVIMGRFKYRVSIGDGGDQNLERRIRLHANFIEYVPLALVIFVLAEIEGVSEMLLHVAGGTLVLGRILHAAGMLIRKHAGILRPTGMTLTFLSILGMSVTCILFYFSV